MLDKRVEKILNGFSFYYSDICIKLYISVIPSHKNTSPGVESRESNDFLL